MKRTVAVMIFVLQAMLVLSCDLRSETAKKEMEKFTSSPTPPIVPVASPTPVDPADSVDADTSLEGDRISINGYEMRSSSACSKFNRVQVNGDSNEVTVSGVCRQIMVNGDANKIRIDAAVEIVFNGSDNVVQHRRYVNGKQPIVVENRSGNVVERGTAVTNRDPKRNIVK